MKSEEEIFNEYQQEEENVKKIEEIKIEKNTVGYWFGQCYWKRQIKSNNSYSKFFWKTI